jgi:hypothetical protein
MAPVEVTAEGSDETVIRYSVKTDFGNGFGRSVKSVSLIFGATRAAGVKPGLRWLEAADVVTLGASRVGSVALDLAFQQTVREFVTIDLSLPPVLVGSPGETFLTDSDGEQLTTSDAGGGEVLTVPEEGLIPAGNTLLTDLSGEQLTTGPFEPVDLIYGPDGS